MIITLLMLLIAVAIVCYIISILPLPVVVRNIAYAVMAIIVLIYVLKLFGVALP